MTQSSLQNLKVYNLSLILIQKTSATSIFIEKDQTTLLRFLLYIIILFSWPFYERNTA